MKIKRLKFSPFMVLLALALALVLNPGLSLVASAEQVVNVIPDIPYTDPAGPGARNHLLHLYIPDIPDEYPLPLVIWHTGSAWYLDTGGESFPAVDFVEFFTQQGYAVAGVNVRSSIQAKFPAQLFDIRKAIRFLRENADDYHIDPDRFAIMGNSSGGWLAAIAATTSDTEQLPGETGIGGVSSAVQAAVPFFPPTDFLEMDEWYAHHKNVDPLFIHDLPYAPLPFGPIWYNPIFGASPESLLVRCTDVSGNLLGIQACPEETQEASPISYIDGDEVPMYILHGEHDTLVPNGQSDRLYEAYAESGNEVWFTSVPDAGHSQYDIIGASEYTVYYTNSSGHEKVWDEDSPHAPAPTWQNIELFINNALN